MARVGRLYYIIVNKASGRIEDNCVECRTIATSISQPIPTTDVLHTVIVVDRIEHSRMKTRIPDLSDLFKVKYQYKWDKGQGKPVEDV